MMCVHVSGGRWIYFKGLAHTIIESGKSKICRMGQQAGDSGSGRANVAVQVQRSFAGRISFIQAHNSLDKAHPYYGGYSASLKVC